MIDRGCDFRIQIVKKEFSGNTDSQRLEIFSKRRDIVFDRNIRAGFVFGIEAGDGLRGSQRRRPPFARSARRGRAKLKAESRRGH